MVTVLCFVCGMVCRVVCVRGVRVVRGVCGVDVCVVWHGVCDLVCVGVRVCMVCMWCVCVWCGVCVVCVVCLVWCVV